MHRVTFRPLERDLLGEGGTGPGGRAETRERPPATARLFPQNQTIFEDAHQADVDIESICGGLGRCSRCRVQIAAGPVTPITLAETKYLSEAELAKGMRLSCQICPRGPVTVLVPEVPRAIQARVKLDLGKGLDSDDPYVIKRVLSLDSTDTDAKQPLWKRILERLARAEQVSGGTLSCYKSLSRELPSEAGTVTAVLCRDRVVALERGNTTGSNYGIAVDLGTTTVAAYLVDLNSATVLDAAACSNSQSVWGADVMSRMSHALEHANGLSELQASAIGDVNGLVSELCGRSEISTDDIYRITLVGNSAMHHLFFGLDVTSLGLAPHAPRVREGIEALARELGIHANREATIHFLPLSGGFVGADTVGVIMSTGIWATEKLTLAVDIGTNGETVLGNRERILCCSNAAGPAFEGAELAFGMRAVPGAIERVRPTAEGDVRVRTIGRVSPRGICGSGVIDVIALLLQSGVVEPSGRMCPPEALPAEVPSPLASRLEQGEDGIRFALVREAESPATGAVYFTQLDVRQVQLASAAIAAARNILLKELGKELSDVKQVYLAGAFGNHIRVDSAVRLGLVPDLPRSAIRFVGNAAGDGAKMALTSRAHLELADNVARLAEHVELGGREEYMDLFMDAMTFPSPLPPGEPRDSVTARRSPEASAMGR